MSYFEIVDDSELTQELAKAAPAAAPLSTPPATFLGMPVVAETGKSLVNIKVVGVGGGGGNAIRHMIKSGVKGVSYVAINTDSKALHSIPAEIKIQLGESGQGAGANPNVARAFAEAARDQIHEALKGADMVFITAGLGKGTGTGASAIVAQIAKEIGALTVGVVTKPFTAEGKGRAQMADAAADELGLHLDSMIIVLNSKLEAIYPDGLMKSWLSAADDVLKSGVNTIVEIINSEAYIGVDFRDVVSIMGSNRGRALMGTARATGSDRAKKAALQAVCCQLLEEENLRTARGVLINITAHEDTMRGAEITEILDTIRSYCADDVNPIYGTCFDDSMGDELQVTVIVSGIGSRPQVRATLGSGIGTGMGQLGQLSGQASGQQSGQRASLNSPQNVAVPMARTGTDDVSFVYHSNPAQNTTHNTSQSPSARSLEPTTPAPASLGAVSLSPSNLHLPLGSPNPTIPTLTEEVPVVSHRWEERTPVAVASASPFDDSGLMSNPTEHLNPRLGVQNRIKSMEDQGIPRLEIPTFLRNQVN